MRILIKNGRLYDGSGDAPMMADLLTDGGIIAKIGAGLTDDADEVIDASGLAVTPGFVDIHRHCDLALMRDPDFGELELRQGITSTIVGNCGLAPVPTRNDAAFDEYMEPVLGEVVGGLTDYLSYTAALKAAKLPINVGYLAAAGAVRYAVKGFDPSPCSEDEINAQRALVAQAMACGAKGLSLGIMYKPECYMSLAEHIALAEEAARFGGVLSTHIRGEGNSLVQSVKEVIQIARAANVRLNISHFKATGISNWHSAVYEAIDCINAARAEGTEVTVDLYPYAGGATTLLSLVPPSLQQQDPAFFATDLGRDALKAELEREHEGWDNMAKSIGWERIIISSVSMASHSAYQGKNLQEIAGSAHPVDMLAELLATEGNRVGVILMSMSWDDVHAIANLPYAALISDALYGGGENPHPRLYGAFPKAIREWVHEQKRMPLETMIWKMTGMPADRVGMGDRGRLQAGKRADILVFDPKMLRDRATYAQPRQMATGMHTVIVNGVKAAQNDTVNCLSAGVALVK
ncbi:MAG: amidohydrolase family protein [Clostridiales bacterium]|nr:amidohydrolase family protein [Clostridiales bacterium]